MDICTAYDVSGISISAINREGSEIMSKEIEFEPAYIYPDDYRKPYLIERYKNMYFRFSR